MTKPKELRDMESYHKAVVLANAHWAWLQTLLEKIHKDAFTHGYGHGRKESKK